MNEDNREYLHFFTACLGYRFFKKEKEVSKSALFWAGYNAEKIILNQTDIIVKLRWEK